MKKTIALAAALFSGMVLASGSALADKMAGSAQEIKGQLTAIDGSFYLIKDTKGVEQRVHFDQTTKKTGDVALGAQVEVYVENGHVTEIKVEK